MSKPSDDRLTIRLGSMSPQVDEACKRLGLTRSELGRQAIAAYLGTDCPVLTVGKPVSKLAGYNGPPPQQPPGPKPTSPPPPRKRK